MKTTFHALVCFSHESFFDVMDRFNGLVTFSQIARHNSQYRADFEFAGENMLAVIQSINEGGIVLENLSTVEMSSEPVSPKKMMNLHKKSIKTTGKKVYQRRKKLMKKTDGKIAMGNKADVLKSHMGTYKTVKQLSKETGQSSSTIHARFCTTLKGMVQSKKGPDGVNLYRMKTA